MEWTSCHETEGTMRLISTPSRLYRALALAEWVTWTLLLAGMFVKYVLEAGEWLVRIGGGLHGFTFLSYAVVTVLVAVDQRWSLSDLLLGLGSAIIPYLSVPFERSALCRVLLCASWGLREEADRTSPERIVAVGLIRPLLAGRMTMIEAAKVFPVLLSPGPPTEWFSRPREPIGAGRPPREDRGNRCAPPPRCADGDGRSGTPAAQGAQHW